MRLLSSASIRVTAQPHCECEVIDQESLWSRMMLFPPCTVAKKILNLENLIFSVALRGFYKQHTIIVGNTKCKSNTVYSIFFIAHLHKDSQISYKRRLCRPICFWINASFLHFRCQKVFTAPSKFFFCGNRIQMALSVLKVADPCHRPSLFLSRVQAINSPVSSE